MRRKLWVAVILAGAAFSVATRTAAAESKTVHCPHQWADGPSAPDDLWAETGTNITPVVSSLTGKPETGDSGLCWVVAWVADDGDAWYDSHRNASGFVNGDNLEHATLRVALHDASGPGSNQTWRFTYESARPASDLVDVTAVSGHKVVTFKINGYYRN